MAVASDANAWALARQGIYFPASSNNSNQDGDLTGQCVSLDKWFLAEMCNVPSPFMARGDAKNFGDNLVAQGLATRVGSPQRGDLVVFPNEAAPWGHIGVMLDAVRMFEENAGVAGVASKVVMTGVGPFRVYASRIGRIDESWRHGPPVFYRVKSYIENVQAKPKEEEVKPTRQQVIDTFNTYLLQPPKDDNQINYYMGRDIRVLYGDVLGATKPNASEIASVFSKYMPGTTDPNRVPYYTGKTAKQLYADVLGAVDKQRGTVQAALSATNDKLAVTAKDADLNTKLQRQVDELTKKNDALLADQQAAQATGNAFLQWLGGLLNNMKK